MSQLEKETKDRRGKSVINTKTVNTDATTRYKQRSNDDRKQIRGLTSTILISAALSEVLVVLQHPGPQVLETRDLREVEKLYVYVQQELN